MAPRSIHLEGAACAGCCAGSQCTAASRELAACSSGRQCVACSGSALTGNSFRLRVGNLVLSPAGVKEREESHSDVPLELCARAGSSEQFCVAAEPEGQPWSTLPLVVSASTLLSGLELRVRLRGAADYLARWTTPIAVNPEVLCRGIVARPQLETGAVLGTASIFLDETHYVELARASTVATLRSTASQFEISTLPVAVYETASTQQDHFALALGPLDQEASERLRATVLSSGGDAKLTLGGDFLGKAIPLH